MLFAIVFGTAISFAFEVPAPPKGVKYSKCSKWINGGTGFERAGISLKAYGIEEFLKNGALRLREGADYKTEGGRELIQLGGFSVEIKRDSGGHLSQFTARGGPSATSPAGGGFWDTILDFKIRGKQCTINRISSFDQLPLLPKDSEHKTQVYTPLCRKLYKFFRENSDLRACSDRTKQSTVLRILKEGMEAGGSWSGILEERVESIKLTDPISTPVAIAHSTMLYSCGEYYKLEPFYTKSKIWEEEERPTQEKRSILPGVITR